MPVYKSNKPTKEGHKWYFKCQYKDKKGKTYYKTSKKYLLKNEASKAEELFLIEIREKINSKITFNQIFDEFIFYKKDKVKNQTLKRDIIICKKILNFLGDVPIKNLTIKQYNQFKNHLNESGLSLTYKNLIHRKVIEMINYSNRVYGIYNDIPKLCGKFNKEETVLFCFNKGTLQTIKCNDTDPIKITNILI